MTPAAISETPTATWMKSPGICNWSEEATAAAGGALIMAVGLDRIVPLPALRQPVHWAIGGLIAPYVFKGGDVQKSLSLDTAKFALCGVAGAVGLSVGSGVLRSFVG